MKKLSYLLKGGMIGAVIGALIGFLPPFNLLSIPIMEFISDSMEPSFLIIFIFALVNAIIYGIIGTAIALFKQKVSPKKNEIQKTTFIYGSKRGFTVSLIGSLILLLPSIVIIFRELMSQRDFYFQSLIYLIYGLFILITAFLMRKRNTLKLGSISSLSVGIIGLIIMIVMLFRPILLPMLFGELLEGGNSIILILWALSSILSIVAGVLGKIEFKKQDLQKRF